MNKLEQYHIDFLRVCATKPNNIHAQPENISSQDADIMCAEGLLIKYTKPTGRFYAIGRYGAQFIKELGNDTEMTKLAINYVISKGYEESAAQEIVTKEGVESILRTQAEEMKQGTQREVTVPTNALGKPEIKFRG
jgi:spore maturation protein SpmB